MLKALVNLFFPNLCFACLNVLGDNEDTICVDCRNSLPVTNFHFNSNDKVAKVLFGRIQVEYGTALFRFEKEGLVQQLIHGLKYQGYENIGFVLGNWLGNELCKIESYSNIDIVIPVPLHKKKLKKRGYNQVAKFGEQISKAIDAKYKDDVLVKVSNNESQSKKGRFARWINSEELFAIKNVKSIENKHILLVDDIITTGATIEACANVLNLAKNIKISIAAIAIA